MKVFSIGYYNAVAETISIEDDFYSEVDALKNLERCAVEYIRKHQGKQQSARCFKTEVEVSADPSFVGMFIFKKDERKIVLMEKQLQTVPGYMWNSQEVKIVRLGTFVIIQHDMMDVKQCGCNISGVKSNFVQKDGQRYMEELKTRLSQVNTNFGLIKINDAQSK